MYFLIDDGEVYDSAFKTLDARDYSSIATIETRRGVVDISSSVNDLQVAVVENSLRYYYYYFEYTPFSTNSLNTMQCPV